MLQLVVIEARHSARACKDKREVSQLSQGHFCMEMHRPKAWLEMLTLEHTCIIPPLEREPGRPKGSDPKLRTPYEESIDRK
jgi:hypothetical protein